MKEQLVRLVALKKKAIKYNAHPRMIARIQENIRATTQRVMIDNMNKGAETFKKAASAFGDAARMLNEGQE